MMRKLAILLALVYLLVSVADAVIIVRRTAGGGSDPFISSSTHDAETTNQTTLVTSLNGTGEGPDISIAVDDLLVLGVCVDGGGGTVITCPTGYDTPYNEPHQTNSNNMALCTKVAVSSDTTDTTVSATLNVAQEAQMIMYAVQNYTGTATSAISCTSDATLNTTDPISPAHSSPSNSLVIRIFCSDAGQITEGSGFASACDGGSHQYIRESNDGTGSGPASLGMCPDSTLGATGSATWTGVLAAAEQTIGVTCSIAD